jgi:hypothetical protein
MLLKPPGTILLQGLEYHQHVGCEAAEKRGVS